MSSPTHRPRSLTEAATFLLVIAVAGIVIGAALWTEGWLESTQRDQDRRKLTEPLRLQTTTDEAFHSFLLGLRVHHYRASSRSQANYLDVYYDTDEWHLLRHGYSFRFRQRIRGDTVSAYSIRLKRERRFLPEGSGALDLADDLPEERGALIAGGEWRLAVQNSAGSVAQERLRDVLNRMGVTREKLKPRIVGTLQRERFDVTDKGRSWFELDQEFWAFRRFDAPESSPGVAYEDIVLDTRLQEGDPELLRRVRTLDQLARMIGGVEFDEPAPIERAVRDLTSFR